MKNVLSTLLVILLCFSQAILSNENNNQNEENKPKVENLVPGQNLNTNNLNASITTNCLSDQANLNQEAATSDFDDLDALSEQGEAAGIEIKAPAKPSFLMGLVIKFGITFLLNPYITIVEKYRSTKNFVIKYSMITWENIFGKKAISE